MAGGLRKHGLHLVTLSLPALAAGNANDAGAIYTYHGFPAQSATAAPGSMAVLDWAPDQVVEANFVTYAALTGQATNYAIVDLAHRTGATLNNEIRVLFSAAGVVAAAYVPANLVAASGATVTGTGTGTLTVQAGVALPWVLTPGDTIAFSRLSNNATGLATPAMSCTFALAAINA
jgi:hypothetical protein